MQRREFREEFATARFVVGWADDLGHAEAVYALSSSGRSGSDALHSNGIARPTPLSGTKGRVR